MPVALTKINTPSILVRGISRPCRNPGSVEVDSVEDGDIAQSALNYLHFELRSHSVHRHPIGSATLRPEGVDPLDSVPWYRSVRETEPTRNYDQ
jgi:hypothetical protein